MKDKALNYDKAYNELMEIIANLQQDNTGLDELSDKIKRANDLISFCKEKLRSTEAEIHKMFDGEEED